MSLFRKQWSEQNDAQIDQERLKKILSKQVRSLCLTCTDKKPKVSGELHPIAWTDGLAQIRLPVDTSRIQQEDNTPYTIQDGEVNMAFETRKWQKSILPVERVPFRKAYTAIFTGITAGMMFPNRTGDFLGRIFILEKGNRIKAAMLTFVGNIAQMLITVSLGCIAWIFFAQENYYVLIPRR